MTITLGIIAYLLMGLMMANIYYRKIRIKQKRTVDEFDSHPFIVFFWPIILLMLTLAFVWFFVERIAKRGMADKGKE